MKKTERTTRTSIRVKKHIWGTIERDRKRERKSVLKIEKNMSESEGRR